MQYTLRREEKKVKVGERGTTARGGEDEKNRAEAHSRREAEAESTIKKGLTDRGGMTQFYTNSSGGRR